MNSHFNPFLDYNEEKIEKAKETNIKLKPINIVKDENNNVKSSNSDIVDFVKSSLTNNKKVNKYKQNVVKKYFHNTKNTSNVINIIDNANLSDENKIKAIQKLYNKIEDEEYKKAIKIWINK